MRPARCCRALPDKVLSISAPARNNSLAGRTVANLFFEPSTRTRASFDLAGKRLGADVLNLDVNTSSRKKGESILDMIYTLQAMQRRHHGGPRRQRRRTRVHRSPRRRPRSAS